MKLRDNNQQHDVQRIEQLLRGAADDIGGSKAPSGLVSSALAMQAHRRQRAARQYGVACLAAASVFAFVVHSNQRSGQPIHPLRVPVDRYKVFVRAKSSSQPEKPTVSSVTNAADKRAHKPAADVRPPRRHTARPAKIRPKAVTQASMWTTTIVTSHHHGVVVDLNNCAVGGEKLADRPIIRAIPVVTVVHTVQIPGEEPSAHGPESER